MLFASPTLVNVLRVFVLNPEREYYQRELTRLTGAHLRQLQRDMERLERTGLVASARHGNRVYYHVQSTHPAWSDLRQALVKTIAVSDTLRSRLESLGERIRIAFVYGSLARGDEGATSDIDVFVVGSATRRELSDAAGPLQDELGRDLNITLYRPDDLHAKAGAGDHFVRSVLAAPKIWLIGDDEALAELAE